MDRDNKYGEGHKEILQCVGISDFLAELEKLSILAHRRLRYYLHGGTHQASLLT